jgi:hypothetical protein
MGRRRGIDGRLVARMERSEIRGPRMLKCLSRIALRSIRATNRRMIFQTATASHSRGAMRPRFANSSRTARGDGAVGGARAPTGTLEAGGEPTSRGKATARAQGKAQRLPALHRPSGRQPFRGAPVRPALALSAAGSPLESGPSPDRTRNIYSVIGIPSIGIFRFRKIFCRDPEVSRSPDGAQRNPGQYRRGDGIPDFTSLHPGYERLRPSFGTVRRAD